MIFQNENTVHENLLLNEAGKRYRTRKTATDDRELLGPRLDVVGAALALVAACDPAARAHFKACATVLSQHISHLAASTPVETLIQLAMKKPTAHTTSTTATCTFLVQSLADRAQGTSAGMRDDRVGEDKLYSSFASLVDGGNKSETLLILQGEFGVGLPPLSLSRPTKTTDMRKRFIGSPDATSCVIVAARASLRDSPVVSATALGHFDCDGDRLVDGLRTMYMEVLLPALAVQYVDACVQTHAPDTPKEESENGFPHPPLGGAVEVEWYVIGGLVDLRHSLPTLADLFGVFFPLLANDGELCSSNVATNLHALIRRALQQGRQETTPGVSTECEATLSKLDFTISHKLRPDGLCFWTLNSYFSSNNSAVSPMARGVRIDLSTGHSQAIDCRSTERQFPGSVVRGVRFLANSEACKGPLAIIPPLEEKPSDCYACTSDEEIISSKKSTASKRTMDIFAFLRLLREHVNFPIWVPPFRVQKLDARMRSITGEEAARWSTTPHCEPPGYGDHLASKLRFAATANFGTIFPSDGKQNCPLLLW